MNDGKEKVSLCWFLDQIESEIQKTDQEIDELVYKLHGLIDEEIKIVEENFYENYNSG